MQNMSLFLGQQMAKTSKGADCLVIDLEEDWTDTESLISLEENKTIEDVPDPSTDILICDDPLTNGSHSNESTDKTQDDDKNSNQNDDRLAIKDTFAEDFEFDFQTIDEAEQTEHILKVRVHANFCMRCGTGFVQKKKLNSHLEKNECTANKNTAEMPLTCSICGQGFFGSRCLRQHFMGHAQTKPFKCKKCCQSFSTVRSLYSHYQCHKGYRPFICDLCPKTFYSSKKLAAHHRDHAGKRPYACKICPKRFNKSRSLAKHKQKHASKKPFKCKFCMRSFAQNSVRNLHMRTHTKTSREALRFLCDVCGLTHVRGGSVWTMLRQERLQSQESVVSVDERDPLESRTTTRKLSESSKAERRLSSSSGSSVEIVEDPLQFTIDLVDD